MTGFDLVEKVKNGQATKEVILGEEVFFGEFTRGGVICYGWVCEINSKTYGSYVSSNAHWDSWKKMLIDQAYSTISKVKEK